MNVAHTDAESYVTLDGDFCVVLYYTVGKYRRLYICQCSAPKDADISMLSGCKMPVTVLYELTGRAFDRFKRSMDYLNHASDGLFYRLPYIFFLQLAALCQAGKNSRLNLSLLVRRYDDSISLSRKTRGIKDGK